MIGRARRARKTRVEVVLHPSTTDCGIASLKMVLGAFGIPATMPEVRAATRYTSSGVTVGNIIKTAKRFGLDGRAVRAELDQLDQLELPAILHWNFNHFVVLEKVGARHATILDPSHGRQRIGLQELSRGFTGVAVEFEPSVELSARPPGVGSAPVRPFLPNLRGLGALTAMAFMIALLSQALVILAPVWMASLVDNIGAEGAIAAIPHAAALVLGMIAAAAIAELAQREMLLRVGVMASLSSSNKLVDHLFRLSYGFFGARRINDLVARVGHIRDIRDLVVEQGIPAAIDLLFGILALFVLFRFSPFFGAISLVMLGIYFLLRVKLLALNARLNQEQVKADSTEMGHLIENLRGILTLKAANIEPQRLSIWQSALHRGGLATLRMRRLETVVGSARFSISAIDQLGIVIAGIWLVATGQLSLGVLIAVLMIRQQLYDRMMTLFDRLAQLALIKMYAYRLADVTGARAGLSWTQPEPDAFATAAPVLRAEDVCFRYADEAPLVVDRTSLTLAPGSMVAIRGPSGEGKSTLLKLLLGLISPESGRVTIDGTELDEAGFRALRDRSGVVLQGEQLFSGTILENLTWFGCDRDMERVEHCARMACIHEDIERLPMGYFSPINEGICNFSGGQIQRMLLARAYYREPQFMLLDEATSALDPELEERVVAELEMHPAAKLCVSHRSLMLERADVVYRMEEGRLVLERDGAIVPFAPEARDFTKRQQA
ncbi:peptidase domain-containing ABC transporter [Erythrobacter sp. JK5]|uniref:peptidase domain-containing ABC transporter n=1 Tax=Erythrobacter sp. JK5 TaxID=2829500 RepID=UPI001BAD7E55|nr:peptidase domain-containing ABC transporter [Erythrobacter sp. JK5]QUL38782.1 peptidase domain-containing ABC transporter [Erythrobacter sp. JK5]